MNCEWLVREINKIWSRGTRQDSQWMEIQICDSRGRLEYICQKKAYMEVNRLRMGVKARTGICVHKEG
jgi:hypothetical protein